jgi:hypothetical protein
MELIFGVGVASCVSFLGVEPPPPPPPPPPQHSLPTPLHSQKHLIQKMY